MQKVISVIIYEPCELIRFSLDAYLKRYFKSVSVICCPKTEAELYAAILCVDFDVVIADLCNPARLFTPNISFIETYYQHHRDKPLIVWGGLPIWLRCYPHELMNLSFFVAKDSSLDQLNRLFSRAFRRESPRSCGFSAIPSNRLLTQKELMVISRLAQGISVKEVSSVFSITEKSVSVHKINAMRKLGIKSLGSLIINGLGGMKLS
ncbi:response regulator transcription factor [Enterobacteriaceae bacterium BIT-l23]|uniref:LuxR C-terminal-related transcriptional regulator n=1 Tax=Jejubacter sp. L23 TaxID=3092086 RepID=UPI0015859B1E|nr:response regulator transcription factor [Enterobacteriaceae bacterium BIT-l23]